MTYWSEQGIPEIKGLLRFIGKNVFAFWPLIIGAIFAFAVFPFSDNQTLNGLLFISVISLAAYVCWLWVSYAIYKGWL